MSVQDFSSQFALDMQGLQRLKHTARQDPSAGLRDTAQQFEALFVQMMLKSMRDAIPTTGLLDSQQTEFYQSLLDQQWAQTMAGRGIGLADHLVAQLEGQGAAASRPDPVADSELNELIAGIPRGTPRVLKDALQPVEASEKEAGQDELGQAGPTQPASFFDELLTGSDAAALGGFMAELPTASAKSGGDGRSSSPPGASMNATTRSGPDTARHDHIERFMERLAQPAQVASRRTGVPAELILAQAALETGWGRHEIATQDGGNSHNLFGIKAGSSWRGKTTDVVTHEYLNGQRTRLVDTFRVYDSFEEAFTDYARLIGDNPRYAAVTTAGSAEQAARELQAGGYATDPAYADKLIAVMNSMGPVETGSDSLVFLRY
ncbi:flagellar assembly peptidoglycan hydrolase FlgJ [Halomonas campisalis]|uniref:Peptidoglycan hydrolase FlgJ n=1 Tax=Billgrantia campisalis TaxID=74661 RepID=A0ABS9P3F2_9GAMM|nr:flagellar assembly peptidoglycan hydrolase FlgJ [Halomonas campisalis]MCG6656259.1 flagellar assembly peptidoglycan hydrolase FlgJ [Halomonas campisalis]MDR5861446.1 flagellar assembly peptidoglycan hydrolase FlgJ [Halomonas campisalis]